MTPGALVVKKTITGPGAGLQGEITIQPVCDGTALPALVIPAGTPAGFRSQLYPKLAAGTVCTITESGNGSNTAVSVVVTGDDQVTVPPGGIVTAELTDTYNLNPGSLVVNKTIAGAGAGQQGQITITVTCVNNGETTTLQPLFVIPAGTTDPASQTYTDIPGGSVCTVVETQDGNPGALAVLKQGSGLEVTVPAGGTATADLSDTYLTGELVVSKTITGEAAGSQGEVTVQTVCDGTALTPDLVVPAGSAANTYAQRYPDVIAGATCTVTETSNGSSSTVTVTTTGSPQDVTIAADGTGAVDVTDTYAFVPGSLTVTKTIAGPSAGQQGPVTIHVDCGVDVLITDVTIEAGATNPDPVTFDDIPAGTVCTVTETVDGSSSTVAVTTTGSPQEVTIPAGDAAVAEITNTYAPAPGALTVTKSIAGPAAGSQSAVTIHAVCDGTPLSPDFVIDAGTASGTTSLTYQDIPAGSSCTVTETVDGSTSTVAVTTVGSPQDVTVPAGGVATAELVDVYHLVPGSLTVTKTINGASAGEQGPITIGITCDGLPLPAFTIPSGATGTQSRTYDNIPAGLTCTVTEQADGSTSTIGVLTTGSPQDVEIVANTEATAELTDTYGPVPGSLEVHKTINGPSAGSQGVITIAVTCGGAALPDWTIPAGTGATTLTNTYEDIPAGSACSVTETANGATPTVTSTVAGANQTVTVQAGTVASLSITDTFSPAPGAVEIVKTIAGPAAGSQGLIGILLICRAPIQVFAMVIPAGHPAGQVSQVFNGVGGGSSCLVAEVIDGHTDAVAVQVTGASQQVTAPAASVASVQVTDTFSGPAPAPVPPAPQPLPPAPQPPLAATGLTAPVEPMLSYAVVAILAGIGLLQLARRRS